MELMAWQNLSQGASAASAALDFVVAGTERCGSSSLHWNLFQHPAAWTPSWLALELAQLELAIGWNVKQQPIVGSTAKHQCWLEIRQRIFEIGQVDIGQHDTWAELSN